MTVSIILPLYNGQKFIKDCIKSLLEQDFSDYEIIIIDNGSTDATVEIVRSFKEDKIRLFCNKENLGQSHARNQGLLHAQGEYFAFTDQDCQVNPNWLSELMKPFEQDKDIMIVGGRIIDSSPRTYWEMVNNASDYISPQSGYVSKITGCDMALKRQFFLNNPFDEGLFAAEDWDLCYRCQQQNKKIFYNDKATVIHHHRSTFKTTVEQQFRYGYSNVLFNIKHRRPPFLNYGSIILVLIAGDFVHASRHQEYYLWFVFCFLYLGLAGYWNTRWGTRPWKEWLATYLGFLVSFSAFCLGNLCFPFYYERPIASLDTSKKG